MKKNITILFLLFYVACNINAQEIRIGFDFGANIAQKTVLDRSLLEPANSYFTYGVGNPDEGLVNKASTFNGYHLGAVFNASYKRFSIYMEPQFYIQRTVIKFRFPYPTERLFGKKAFRMPLYFTYKFFKKENSLFALAGISFNREVNSDIQNLGSEYYIGGDDIYEYFEDFDFQDKDENGYQTVNYGDDHFDGFLYDDRPYWNYMFGLGRTFGKVNASFRFQRELDITDHFVEAKIWQIELSINILLLSTKDFTKKHFLYVE